MIEQSHRWRKTAAAAAFALLALSASEVSALSLGRITVQSALGEPLKAEIEVASISAEEASSLKANVASPAAFVAAGLEYNPAMSGLQATLLRSADGRAFIRLSSDRIINEPFVDMILEASWAAGRIVRDYTMLFDPPALKQATAPTLPQTVVATPAPMLVRPVPPPPDMPPVTGKPALPMQPPKPAKAETSDARKLTVKTGDSAAKIAGRTKASDVSLDQMLVALLRANPESFVKGNLNRLRAGAVLDLPTPQEAQAIPPDEATQTVLAQSKDFNEFRRNLANNAPKASVEAADRTASGSVEAKVDDRKPGSSAADKLTLSKGALKAKANEAKIAKERADKDAADRTAELAKNIADLNKLSVASGPKPTPPTATASKPASAPMAPVLSVAVVPAAVASAPLARPVASAPVAETEAASPALVIAAPASPASAVEKPASPVAKAEPIVAESPMEADDPSMLDQLRDEPALPVAGGGLIALIGGFALYSRQQRKKRAASSLESPLQTEARFGDSGGQKADSASGNSGSSSQNANQFADSVDPVAEADVYLAYGRNAQAEDILLEAILHNPGRVAIHNKLLDIYAMRGDADSFMGMAKKAFQLVGPDSAERQRICELGLTIDPENPLYQAARASTLNSVEPHETVTESGRSPMPTPDLAEVPRSRLEPDMDMDFSADDLPTFGASDGAAVARTTLNDPSKAPSKPDVLPTEMQELAQSMDGLNLDLPELRKGAQQSLEAVAPKAPAASEEGMLEFDLNSLSLDLGSSDDAGTEQTDTASVDNSLETKLALAEEFVSIGDQDGARALIEEVVAEAKGYLREKAQRALASLS